MLLFGDTLSFIYLSHTLTQLGSYLGVTQNILGSIRDIKKPAVYHISRPIRCTVIFSLGILEKIMMNVF